ncbi:MAG: hypothetical protein ACI85K_000765 [Hyphomicrobiaceae bacterium]|jgi:hypothetical protein
MGGESTRCVTFAPGWFAETQSNRWIRRGFGGPTWGEGCVHGGLLSRGADS